MHTTSLLFRGPLGMSCVVALPLQRVVLLKNWCFCLIVHRGQLGGVTLERPLIYFPLQYRTERRHGSCIKQS
ncbi:hypothetical protein CFIMG_005067RAa [Ceratocystis fimbriata CBS 114723]|uniref:Secreted protein n=1 Tax=Ceratocystis fimbriata CBS 114723 TaxID=1035309 RepID=A0A2C5X6H0_9PEZI|nr:hypothetical protein CFIMG_005067RAa [Ceratocystis fimbriata CBS 114723]